jgi:RimJ/RimL family protein N-acetyltransferase
VRHRIRLPIVTARLVLREFAASDRALLARADSDDILDHLPGRGRSGRRRRSWAFAVLLRRNGKLIGACDLAGTLPREADIGYVLVRRHWHYGYATEVARALVAAGFGQLQLQRISAFVAIENERSRRVLVKSGFQWEGLLRRHAFASGRWRDCHRYATDRAAWEAQAQSATCTARRRTRSSRE